MAVPRFCHLPTGKLCAAAAAPIYPDRQERGAKNRGRAGLARDNPNSSPLENTRLPSGVFGGHRCLHRRMIERRSNGAKGMFLRPTGFTIALALFACASGLSRAHATCSKIAGTWWLYSMTGESPGIHTTSQSVVVDATVNTAKNQDGVVTGVTLSKLQQNIPVFAADHPYGNGPISVLTCRIVISANGAVSA